MHNRSYYVNILIWPWLRISIPIILITNVWIIVNWRYARGSKAMEAITKLACFLLTTLTFTLMKTGRLECKFKATGRWYRMMLLE